MHLCSGLHEGFSSLCPQHTMGLAQGTSCTTMFLHPPMTFRYPAKREKKKVMELAEHEYVLEAPFGGCPKDCHTAYKNGVQEWS